MKSPAKILIVDDISQNLQVLAGHLDEWNYKISMAKSGEGAIKAVENDPPDLILLDISMPEMSGFEVCTYIKSNPDTADIPIIFVTARTDIDDLLTGFKRGAVDYITKPFNKLELDVRIKTHLKIHFLEQELKEKNRELELATITDPLTGIMNRRGMIQRMEQEYSRLKRQNGSAVMAICDIDNFKQINDTYGHDCGDFILTATCDAITRCIRQEDLFCRWGGEEFLLFFTDCQTIDEGLHICEKIRQSVYAHTCDCLDIKLTNSISTGFTLVNSTGNIDEDVKKADTALYRAKNEGKNRVCRYGQ